MSIGKPMHTRSIVTKKAGEDIPEALLLKLCKENMSALGILIKDGTKLEYEKYGTEKNKMDDNPEAFFSFLKGILRSQKKKAMMLVFHDMPPEFDEGEIQPWFPIRDSKNNPMLAVAVEGDFPGREVDGDSEMYGLMNEYLGPKIEELYKFAGNNINKLMNWLKADSFDKDLKNTYGHRAEFVFFPHEGDPFALGKNELGVTGTWGTCSNAYGYTEAALEAATLEAQPAAPRSKFAPAEDDVKPVKAVAAEVDDKGIHHIPEAPKPEVIPPQVEPKPVTDPIEKVAKETPEGSYQTPPEALHGKDLKKWYRQMNYNAGLMDDDGRQGALNKDWTLRPRVFVKTKTVAKSMTEIGQTAIGTTVKETAEPRLPVISGSEQAKINDFIKKYTSNRVVDNPLELQKQESQLAVFSELIADGKEQHTDRWSTSFIFALSKTHPDAIALAYIEERRRKIRLRDTIKAGTKTLGELTGTEAPASQPIAPSKPETEVPAVHTPRKTSKYA